MYIYVYIYIYIYIYVYKDLYSYPYIKQVAWWRNGVGHHGGHHLHLRLRFHLHVNPHKVLEIGALGREKKIIRVWFIIQYYHY